MTHKLSILLVEDEKNICDFISTSLSAQDYRISTAHTGKEALPIITSQCPDLILLDLGLPDMDGIEIIRQVRTWSSVPIIVLSARTQEQEKVRALDLGADDYLTKPFGVMELIARVKAVLRRTMEEDKFLTLGDIFLDDEKHMVYVKDVPCSLTFKEYELLKLLLHNAGIVVTREIILERVWGIDFEGESRTLDMHIRTLRQKLGEAGSMIRTVRNVGYMIE